MRSSDSKGPIIAAIISGVFLLTATVISGFFLIQANGIKVDVGSTATAIALVTPLSAPTSTPYPTYTPYPTLSPYPTPDVQAGVATPIVKIVTSTPRPTDLPTPTPESLDTPAGTILDIGQSWRSQDLFLTLKNVTYTVVDGTGCNLGLEFSLENQSAHPIILSIRKDYFSATDNLGGQPRVTGLASGVYGCPPVGLTDSPLPATIDAGQMLRTFYLGFAEDIANPSISSVVVTVRGLSRFEDAKWKIPIYH